ncbi:MAG: hypothetical protein KDA91_05995 [Planctomycetaceae bacterium]|nr:hypothetical protein [Planctomycetaceae bacterium]
MRTGLLMALLMAYPTAIVAAASSEVVNCEGRYQHHLQGFCLDANAVYWSFTTTLVKTDRHGKLLHKVPVDNHHGDVCLHEGRLYVAVNLGQFNHPDGKADSWVYVYDASDLRFISRHECQQVFHGAGGIAWFRDHFFVVGGLPDAVEENYVYEYDGAFNFIRKHVIQSGHTHLGIQTATCRNGQWFFGCYGDPKILLVTDSQFRLLGRFEFDCSLGVATDGDALFAASGKCSGEGCGGNIRAVVQDDSRGLRDQE